MRLKDPILSFKNTVQVLEYIGALHQPEIENGGFNNYTISAARSALFHINKLMRIKTFRQSGRRQEVDTITPKPGVCDA